MTVVIDGELPVYAEIATTDRLFPQGGPWTGWPGGAWPNEKPATLYQERVWRQLCASQAELEPRANILASRWVDQRSAARREQAEAAPDRYVIAIALRPVRLRLRRGTQTVFEGTMPSGMMHVSEPGQPLEAEFFTPCDFVHLHVAAEYLCTRRAAAASAAPGEFERSLNDLLVRDVLAAQLARTLMEELNAGDPLYVESVGQTIVTRLLAHRPAASRAGALPKWRLRRVQDYIAANIAESLTLADLAEKAGLSRMHFAAQFRAATGCRPHDYLLQHRIECAKQILSSSDLPLVEVALSVGFQTQSHFSTVFKRLTGETPGRWQRASCGEAAG